MHGACGAHLVKIGEETSEQLDYQPASLFVTEHVRFKYACQACEGHVVTAALPAQPIEKGRPGPGLLAQVLTAKYADHLPLNRQVDIFARHGVTLARQTLGDWVADAATLLEPRSTSTSRARVLASKVIHTDDTPVPVQDHERPQTRDGRLWVYVGDGQPGDDRVRLHADAEPGRARAPSSGTSAGICRPMPTPATTRCMRRAGWWRSGAGPMRGGTSTMPGTRTRRARCWRWASSGSSTRWSARRKAARRRRPGAPCGEEQAPPVLERFKTWLDEQADIAACRRVRSARRWATRGGNGRR